MSLSLAHKLVRSFGLNEAEMLTITLSSIIARSTVYKKMIEESTQIDLSYPICILSTYAWVI